MIRDGAWLIALAALGACRVTTYSAEQETVRRFALAVAAGDTVAMRRLSLPVAGSKMATALDELPHAYRDVVRQPFVIRRGNPQSTVFFVPSRALAACRGGVVITVAPGDHPLIAGFGPYPDASDATNDPCRPIVDGLTPSRPST